MIKAPYNFVPLASKVYNPDWAEKVSLDKPFQDGEDGTIELEMTNVTAMFTRNGQGREGGENYSAHVRDANGNRHYYIPGTSLKGCFRSIMEIMTYAKMGPYNNDSFAMPRAFDTKDSTNAPYINATKHVRCGWLRQKGDENYEIIPCKNGIQEISHAILKNKFPNFYTGADHQTAQSKQESLTSGGELYPILCVQDNEVTYKVNNQMRCVPEGSYRVVCTGYMNGKNHEYLFSTEELNALPISAELFHTFESVHSKTEYYSGHGSNHGFLRTLLQSGKSIPVFFTTDEEGVVAIGVTKKLRIPYAYSVGDAIANCRTEKVDVSKPDMPETIFGYTHKDYFLKGRVSFGNAFCTDEISDDKLLTIQGVQGQPSASFYPLYLRHDNHKYSIYSNKGVQIAGRKRYRISKGDHLMPLPQGNENENVLGRFYALPSGHTFKGKVHFHNLRKVEIGALIAAITLNNTSGTFVNIGLAKSFGYGKLSVGIKLVGLMYDVDEYLRAFEMNMLQHGFNLSTDANMNVLAAIASEHDDAEMEMMDMEGYKEAKNNKTFSQLTEKQVQLKTLINAEEFQKYLQDEEERQKEVERMQVLKEEYENYIRQGDLLKGVNQWKDAKDQYIKAMERAVQLNISSESIQNKIAECDVMISQHSQADLNTTLVGKTSLGNIAGTTKKWCACGNVFTSHELSILIQTISSLPEREKKGLKGKKQDFVKAIGTNWTEKLLEHFGLTYRQ